MSVTTRMNDSWLWLSWLFPQLPPQMTLPGFKGIWQIFPLDVLGTHSFCSYSNIWVGGWLWGCFGVKWEEVRIRAEQRRREETNISPNQSQLKPLRIALLRDSPPPFPLASLRHSFLPSFLFIYSPHAFFPFSTADWDQMWGVSFWRAGKVEYRIWSGGKLAPHGFYFLLWTSHIIQFSEFCFLTPCRSGYEQCSLWLSLLQINEWMCILKGKWFG